MEKELSKENESEIYQTFLKDFVVEKTKNKILCVNITWSFILMIFKNKKYRKFYEKFNKMDMNFDVMKTNLISKINEIYKYSLFSNTKNQYKKFCEDIPKTESIFQDTYQIKNPKKFYNQEFKCARFENKTLIENTIKKLVNLEINNLIQTKSLLKMNKNDDNNNEKIEELEKEIAKLKNISIKQSAKKQNKINSLERELKDREDQITKLNKIRDEGDGLKNKYIKLLETLQNTKDELEKSNREKDEFKKQLDLLVNKIQDSNH